MRAFIALCLVAVACADQLGYNYQPVGHSGSGLSFTPGAGAYVGNNGVAYGGAAGGYGGNAGGGYVSNNGAGYGGNTGGGSIDGGFGNTANGANYGNNGGNSAPSYSAPAELVKEFYSFSAPEDDFVDPHAAERAASSLKQGLRVIFIRSPENSGLENAALALAKQAAQQQTAIYVLNKQADIGDLANRLNALGSNNNAKPEVHFVKYRTAEDAANAQRAIQGQYDSLGGISHNINGGLAPVINFASQAPIHTANPQAPQNTYLPSSVFRFRL
uniref:DUF243 domain-containing protein n=1 Tax=Stomoxys calcitrans TaxID=35570 RepID=A0A1I8Q8L8_STOCA